MASKEIEMKILGLSVSSVVLAEALAVLAASVAGYASLMITGATRLLEIILMLLIVVLCGKGVHSIGLAPKTIFRGIQRGILWSAGLAGITAVLFTGLLMLNTNLLNLIKIRVPENHKDILFLFLTGGLIGPIAEEILFRGIIFGYLRRWGALLALTVSTFLFVIAHPSLSGPPVIQIAGGIIFALSYELEGSLMVPVIIHILGNMAVFCISL